MALGVTRRVRGLLIIVNTFMATDLNIAKIALVIIEILVLKQVSLVLYAR